MKDSQPGMLGHVPLGLRLVFEGAAAGTAARRTRGSSLPDSLAASHAPTSVPVTSVPVTSAPASSAPASSDPASFDPATSDPAAGTANFDWHLVGLLPEDSDLDGIPSGDAEGTAKRVSAGQLSRAVVPARMTLDRDEAEGYYLNLTSPQPSLFVLLRQQEVASASAARGHWGIPEAEAVTASYSEAARWMDGGMVVVRTALPEPMLAWIAEFAQYHFKVEGKKKRGGFRPSFLSREEFGKVARTAREEAGKDVTPSVSRAPDPHPVAGVEANGS